MLRAFYVAGNPAGAPAPAFRVHASYASVQSRSYSCDRDRGRDNRCRAASGNTRHTQECASVDASVDANVDANVDASVDASVDVSVNVGVDVLSSVWVQRRGAAAVLAATACTYLTVRCACMLTWTIEHPCSVLRWASERSPLAATTCDYRHPLELAASTRAVCDVVSCAWSCHARVRPCAAGRCGRCPPGSGVMSDLFFFPVYCWSCDLGSCGSQCDSSRVCVGAQLVSIPKSSHAWF